MSASSESIAQDPISAESVNHEALAAVRSLREALRSADVEAVQAVRWLAPRPPGERDLLSDLAAAEGISSAIHRLCRFWQQAEVRPERVRCITPLEVEVYERLSLPGESLPVVTLLRREAEDSPWRVVCTTEAQDERFTLWVAVVDAEVNDVEWTHAFTARHGERSELVMDGDVGVLGHPTRGWLVNVRAPFVPSSWPDALPGEGGRVLELSTGLSPDAEDRREQLGWMLQAARVFLEQLGGQAAYVPAHDKLVLAQALGAAADGLLTPEQMFRFWARLEEADGYIFTTGLRYLGVPELEAPSDLLSSVDATARLVRWLGGASLDASIAPCLGTELLLGEASVLLVGARRGPRRGRSYGRWGALALVRTEESFARSSRTRMRVPASVF